MRSAGRANVVDVAGAAAVAALGTFVVLAHFLGYPEWLTTAAGAGLVTVGLYALYARVTSRPDHLRAEQSQRILEIASDSLAYLRQGLNSETAQAVSLLALSRTEAAAVAITDRDTVLGFAGAEADHHTAGGPIITKATREAIDNDEARILETKEEIGCPRGDCSLRAAIVVPLEVRGQPVGALKFYYSSARQLNETQQATVEGLARLLSTQLELSELDRQTELASNMELKALQSQINPHFLFNTINTIAALIRTDPPRARELLREFAAFYRRTLESAEELIPLQTEIEYVRRYLVFERARFGEGRIRFSEDIPGEALDVQVPAFVLQPLVENAVQHGIKPSGTLHITVSGVLSAAALELRVRDDGRGIPQRVLPRVLEPGFGGGLGIALKNVDDRLKGYYGPESGLEVSSVEGEGTTVRVTLSPLRARDPGGA